VEKWKAEWSRDANVGRRTKFAGQFKNGKEMVKA